MKPKVLIENWRQGYNASGRTVPLGTSRRGAGDGHAQQRILAEELVLEWYNEWGQVTAEEETMKQVRDS